MAELRYPRFNTIYASRDEAIAKLDNLSRSYAEPVTIRYYGEDKKICVILAMYKSDKKGDYVINFDEDTGFSGDIDIEKLGESFGDSMEIVVDETGKKVLDVKVDNSTITKTEDGSLSITKVYGGTF